jgi:galactokinase/mevalonate kinase-like predicted kinase
LPAYAPVGKVFMPLPALRWKKGQQIDQNLLDLQLPFLEEILDAAPSEICCLIASGDVLNYFNTPLIKKLPNVDVLCFGMWADAVRSSHHGVFLSPKDAPEKLEFVLQKPSPEEIQDFSDDYFYMIDTGIWLLSEKAVSIIMEKSSWDDSEQKFKNDLPDYYDLYTEFGMALGDKPTAEDSDISSLSSAVYSLDDGHFLHFGKNRDLFSSTYSLQNLVLDQRRCLKPPEKFPTIFTQNSIVEILFTESNTNIWIENSYINAGWKLNSEHILTGVPENNWSITIQKGVCLDFVPLSDDKICIRPYGIDDAFRGSLADEKTMFFNIPFKQWLDGHNLSIDDINYSTDDLQFAEIFPIFDKKEITGEFVQWLVDVCNSNECCKKIWDNAQKISSDQIAVKADLKALIDQRNKYLYQIINLMAKNYRKSIFYRLDLKHLAQIYHRGNLELPLPPEESTDALTKIHYYAFCSEVKKRNRSEFSDDLRKSYQIQQNEIIENSKAKHLPAPETDILKDQIIWGRSPVRLDLAGGWSDTPPYCISFGGKVVNLAVNLNGQPPIQAFVRLNNKSQIVLRSIDLGKECIISDYKDIENYRNIGDAFSIPKAALKICGFTASSGYRTLKSQLDDFGGGLDLTFLAAVPKGSGLGTSSILAACILNVLSEACGYNWDKFALSEKALVLEQMLTTGGGWQDQIGGIFRGLKFIETESGFEQTPKIKTLPDYIFKSPEYKQTVLLYYTGITRVAKNILDEIVRGMFLNSSDHLLILEKIRSHAGILYEICQCGDRKMIAEAVKQSWIYNTMLDSGTNPPEIQRIIDVIEDYSDGYKLTGAGGGGYMLIFAKSPESALTIKKLLSEQGSVSGARFVDFSISDTGIQVTRS